MTTAVGAPSPALNDPTTTPPNVYILGDINGNNWATNVGVPMTLGADGLYTATIIADGRYGGYNYFSFTTMLAEGANDWETIAPYRFGAFGEDIGNFVVTDEQLGNEVLLTSSEFKAFQIPTGTYTLSLNLDEMTLVIEKLIRPNEVYILGDANGNTWAPNVGVPMTLVMDGQFTATITVNAQYDGYGFIGFTNKLSESESGWDDIEPYSFSLVNDDSSFLTEEQFGTELPLSYESNLSIGIPEGKYTLTVDLQNMTLVVKKYVESQDVYILGDINGNNWATNVGVPMTLGTDGLYTATINADGRYSGYNYFSFTTMLAESANDWVAIAPYRFGAASMGDPNFMVTDEQLGKEIWLTYVEFQALQIPEGTYNLTLNLDEMTLVIEKFTMPNEVYILGDINGNNWATNVGVPMTHGADGLFTATIIADGSINGYNYFSFTTKLAEDANDWEAIAPYRFGAVSDGDFWVTNKYLGVDLSLTYDYGQAFRIEQGQYLLTVDLQNLKLVIADIHHPTSITQHPSSNTFHPSEWWYTLDGRRVDSHSSLPKGIYIHNGKKIVK